MIRSFGKNARSRRYRSLLKKKRKIFHSSSRAIDDIDNIENRCYLEERKKRYPVSIVLLASKISDRRAKWEEKKKKEEKKTLSSKCFLVVGRISTSWEIIKKFEHTCRLSTCRFHKFRRLIAFLRMKTAADPRRHRAQPAASNAKLCPNLITTALNEFNRQPAQLDV